jgi:regulator of PEP synthase PpsR (kinase-PPPase family)
MVMEGGYYVYVVSDATGATGEMVLRAALTQFETAGAVVERMTQVRTIDVTSQSIE